MAPRIGRSGRQISALRQPVELPSLAQRWRFVEETIAKAPAFKVVPMIGSMGCPYTCSFCIDSVVDYQPLAFEQIRADLRFLLGKLKRPGVAWHDPNFGVRFDDYMTAIEDVVPPGRMRFIAESSLSLLSEPHLQRLQKNGFVALLPGIESWFELGNKSKTGRNVGLEKVRQVADHVNTILRYVPYVQTNFVLGLDSDEGEEPFELTKRFLDLAPGAYPAVLAADGVWPRRAAELWNCRKPARPAVSVPSARRQSRHERPAEELRLGRILPARGRCDPLCDVLAARAYRRFQANRGLVTKSLSVVRVRIIEAGRVSGQGPRPPDHRCGRPPLLRRREPGAAGVLPRQAPQQPGRALGGLCRPGAIMHDQNAYLKSNIIAKMLKRPASGNLPRSDAAMQTEGQNQHFAKSTDVAIMFHPIAGAAAGTIRASAQRRRMGSVTRNTIALNWALCT